MNLECPSVDEWLREVKNSPDYPGIGMYLVHNGVVRGHSRAGEPVSSLELTVDRRALDEAVSRALAQDGVVAVRVWVNEGHLKVGDDIMLALVAGDIRDNVFPALQGLVGDVKSRVVKEKEIA
jgi:molybdopterin synthase catalytic subunit